jgi:hypothetical protein
VIKRLFWTQKVCGKPEWCRNPPHDVIQVFTIDVWNGKWWAVLGEVSLVRFQEVARTVIEIKLADKCTAVWISAYSLPLAMKSR